MHTKIKDEEILEEMLKETVRQAIEKGIIKSNSLIVDSTHTNSKTKITHGLIRARSVRLLNMRIQSYIMHIVTNI